DGTTGLELWKSDGTTAGTVLVADIVPGSGSSLPNHLTAVGATLFFTAFDPAHGIELWKSDGTAAGTGLVADFQPGKNSAGPSDVAFVNGALFFSADDGQTGREPWILPSDPPAASAAIRFGAREQERGLHTAAGVQQPDEFRRAPASDRIIAVDALFGKSDPETDWLEQLSHARQLGRHRGVERLSGFCLLANAVT